MKVLRVDDLLHEMVVKQAKEEGRTVSRVANQILEEHFDDEAVKQVVNSFSKDTPSPENTEPPKFEKNPIATPKGATTQRDYGEVMADIRQAEADRDEELRYCQDTEVREQINDRYAIKIADFWKETK